MIRIGITGSIGAGKTTISKIFEDKDIPVFNSDLTAREAEKNPEIRQAFLDIVGHDILIDGEIDRNKMRARVFGDNRILSEVNALITPYVAERFEKFVVEKESEGHDMVVLESAILFETHADKNFDYVVSVIADKMTRVKRVMARDNMNLEEVLQKMNAQISDDHKVLMSDFVIVNEDMKFTNTNDLLDKQVQMILISIFMTKFATK